jgi:hypothetical protein
MAPIRCIGPSQLKSRQTLTVLTAFSRKPHLNGGVVIYLIVSGQLYVLKPLARSAQTSSVRRGSRVFHS